VPLQEDNRECEESWICDDQLRLKIPIFFYDQHIERFTKDQLESLEYWHAVIRNQCDQQHTELVDQLDASHSFSSRLHHMHPSCWQTGLLDMGNSYAYQYKDMTKHLLGENNHDRDSSRETLIRFTLPFNLEQLEDMSPMDYLNKYCIISDIR
ncbi:unnamed protein product, partial [Hymenolepis diminuta]